MDTKWHPELSAFSGPKYLALSRALREAIRSGTLPEGERLPTVRDLAWRLQLTPGTVARAYQLATQEGLLAATVGRGTFVAASAPRLGPTQPLYTMRPPDDSFLADFRPPQLPDVGQAAYFKTALLAMAEATAEGGGHIGGGWLDYPSQEAEAGLRAAVLDWLGDAQLGPTSAEDVMLTHGGQNAIGLVLDCVLRGEKPVVLLEELAYPGFRYALRSARAEAVAVEIDREGIVPEALRAACRRHGPQVLCLTTEAQNPTTGRMSLARRREVAQIAREFDLQIIEDDSYSQAGADMPSLRALAPERVWLTGGVSKNLSSALRFGFVICPPGMGEAGRLTAQYAFFALSRPVSALMEQLFTSGAAAEIRAKVQAAFAQRVQMLVNHLGGFDIAWQPSIPYVWVNLPLGWRASVFTRQAEAEGVLVRSADEYALVSGRAPNAVRLAIPGNIDLEIYELALERLAQLLANPPSAFNI